MSGRTAFIRRTWEYNPAVYAPGVTTATTDARRLFSPYYGTMTGYNDNGVSRYNSFQASLLKRLSLGFTLQLNYTFAKSIDDVGEAARIGRRFLERDDVRNVGQAAQCFEIDVDAV